MSDAAIQADINHAWERLAERVRQSGNTVEGKVPPILGRAVIYPMDHSPETLEKTAGNHLFSVLDEAMAKERANYVGIIKGDTPPGKLLVLLITNGQVTHEYYNLPNIE